MPKVQVVANQGGEFLLLWLQAKYPDVDWVPYYTTKPNESEPWGRDILNWGAKLEEAISAGTPVKSINFSKDAKINRLEKQVLELREELIEQNKRLNEALHVMMEQNKAIVKLRGETPQAETLGRFELQRPMPFSPEHPDGWGDDDDGLGGVREPRRPRV